MQSFGLHPQACKLAGTVEQTGVTLFYKRKKFNNKVDIFQISQQDFQPTHLQDLHPCIQPHMLCPTVVTLYTYWLEGDLGGLMVK